MEAINAFYYVMGVYALTLGISLFVAVVIGVIRWATADRHKSGAGKRGGKRTEAIT